MIWVQKTASISLLFKNFDFPNIGPYRKSIGNRKMLIFQTTKFGGF